MWVYCVEKMWFVIFLLQRRERDGEEDRERDIEYE